MSNRNRPWLFYIVTAFFWFSLYAYVPFVAPYAAYLGADLRLVGLIAGAYGFTQMALRIPLGIYSDRIGRRKIFVLLGLVFAGAAGFFVFFMPSPYILLLARALGGVAASSWVTFTVLGTSFYPSTKTTKAMGDLSACNSLGRMAALLLGGLLAQSLGLGFAFLLGTAGGVVGLVCGFFIEEKPPGQSAPPTLRQLLETAKDKQLLACSVLGVIAMFISFATTFGFVPLAASLLDASQFQLGMLGVVSTVPGIFMAPLAGSVMPRKLGVCVTLVIGFLLSGIGSALVAFSATLFALFLVQIVASIGAAILGTLLLGLCIHTIPTPRRATAMGFFQALYGIGMFFGPFTMGQISYTFGLTVAFIFIGFVGLFGAICTIIYTRIKYITY